MHFTPKPAIGSTPMTCACRNLPQVHLVPSCEFESNLTRFELPAAAVAYSTDGGSLATGSEDGSIKLIDTVEKRVRVSALAAAPLLASWCDFDHVAQGAHGTVTA